MKQVLRHGSDYLIKCEKCDCIFSYGIADVGCGIVTCPDCRTPLWHKDGKKLIKDDKICSDNFDYVMFCLKSGKLPDLDCIKHEFK